MTASCALPFDATLLLAFPPGFDLSASSLGQVFHTLLVLRRSSSHGQLLSSLYFLVHPRRREVPMLPLSATPPPRCRAGMLHARLSRTLLLAVRHVQDLAPDGFLAEPELEAITAERPTVLLRRRATAKPLAAGSAFTLFLLSVSTPWGAGVEVSLSFSDRPADRCFAAPGTFSAARPGTFAASRASSAAI